MKHSAMILLIVTLLIGGTFSCGEETHLGSCIVLDKSINDDLCTDEWDDECTGNQAEWISGTCEENGLTKGCANDTFVEQGVPCPGEESPGESCIYMNDSFGDEFCFEEDEEDCVDIGGEMEEGTCEALGFTVVCQDMRVEDGVECPTMDIGSCILINDEYDVCWTEEEYDCYASGGDWDDLSCADYDYTEECGDEVWVWDGEPCPEDF